MADGVVVSVNTGKPKALTYKQKVVQSGIFKIPQEGPVYLAKENLKGTSRRTLFIMAERIKQSACMLVIIFQYGGRNLTELLSRGHLAKILRSRDARKQISISVMFFKWGKRLCRYHSRGSLVIKLLRNMDWTVFLPTLLKPVGPASICVCLRKALSGKMTALSCLKKGKNSFPFCISIKSDTMIEQILMR